MRNRSEITRRGSFPVASFLKLYNRGRVCVLPQEGTSSVGQFLTWVLHPQKVNDELDPRL